ncbi:MAG: hypothetical protein IKE66_03180 [Hyphomicrobium sp.]|nr:hypothetical protein [Hyphomicrobium sp.]
MSSAAAKKDPVEVEARNAAADAAADARADVREEASKAKAAVTKLEKAKSAANDALKATWKEFTVDVWITPFNSIEFGFWKRDRNRGKSRQFTTDMDVFAEINENGERTGVLGYRKELWNGTSGTDKRLVFKLFSETLNWRASMDMMLGRSIQQTIGARGLPVTTYSINTSTDDALIVLERSANKWPLCPEYFSFFVLDGSVPKFYRIRRDIINLGGDYSLIDQTGETVGYLDGAVLTIGGRWKGSVRGDHADPRIMTVMKLFAGLIVFNPEARRHVKTLARDIRKGRIQPDVHYQEADLYMNPRRVR